MITKYLLFLSVIVGSIQMASAQNNATISSAQISFTFVSKDVDGSISGFESDSTIDLENPEASKFKGAVKVETIKTGNFLRDWSLKGGKYFDADDHPKITFESSEITKTTSGFSVKGAITIKGKSESITIDFQKKDNQLTGTTTLFSSDFGIDIKDDREDNEVRVKLVFTLK